MNRSWAIAAAIGLAASGGTPAAGREGDRIRIHSVRPSQFEFEFTAIVRQSPRGPVLSFNDRGGRTYFACVGEDLAGYTLTAFEPRRERVFNPAVQSNEERRAGTATLRAPDGAVFALELGKPLLQPGWTAWLVDLETGQAWDVREGDRPRIGGEAAEVTAVEENSVRLSVGGGTRDVAMATDAEKQELKDLWARRWAEAEAARAAAAPKAEEPPPPPVVYLQRGPALPPPESLRREVVPGMVFGSEFRYPVEFRVIPGVRSAMGVELIPPTVVPVRFGRRMSGLAIECR